MQRHLKNSYAIFFTFFLFQLRMLPLGLSQQDVPQSIGIQQAAAQRIYQAVQDVPVSSNERQLGMPWAGGLNAALLQTADLNGDGQEELIAFDRSSQSMLVFAWENGSWNSRQELACLLPPQISNWFIMQDYDKDGQKDIFTYTSAGIQVFRNTSKAGESTSWELVEQSVSYESNGRNVNLLVNSGDVPAIEDIDGDGDLDVLIYDPSGGGGLQYYRNLSMENTGQPDQFLYTLESRQWGGLSECSCQEFAYYGEACEQKDGAGHRVMHTGGKSLLLFDVDADGDFDLLNGFEVCEELYFLENKGTNTEPLFDEFSTRLPGAAEPTALGYPAAFSIDVEQNGVQDLIITSQLSRNSSLQYDYSQSVWWYRAGAIEEVVEYSLQTKAFLQENMLDIGGWSVPAFADVDADGDLDMLLGNFGKPRADGFYAGLQLYLNVGTAENPAFRLENEDYLNLKKLRLMQLQPQFTDFNNDGSLDLVLIATETNGFRRKGFLFLNSGSSNTPFQYSGTRLAELPFQFGAQENPYFYDLSGDGLPDLLTGKFDGSLSYYENEGTAEAPSFGPEVKNYMDIGLDNFRRPLVPSVSDLTGNGQGDLLLADGSGSIRYIENVAEAKENLAEPKDLIVCEGSEAVSWFGRRSWPVAVPLRSQEAPMVVVGNFNGGLWLLQADALLPGPEGEELTINVFPNPVNPDEQEIFLKANLPARIKLISISGQVLKIFDIPANAKIPLPVAGFAAGLYVVQAEYAGGKQFRKFILLR